jgi:putative flippase GtrA
MRSGSKFERMWELVRFYQAAVLNTAFGISAYALLVWLGLNRYEAQLASHLMGTTFNYVTYSRHVFRNAAPAKLRFIASYAVNYGISLATLAVVTQFFASPYVAGILTVLAVSLLNYFVLKHLVFRIRAA